MNYRVRGNYMIVDRLFAAAGRLDRQSFILGELATQFGEAIEVPDTAVIGYVGNKPLTWGEAQRIVTNTAEDRLNGNRTPDEATARLNELREIYARATWSDRKLQAIERLELAADGGRHRQRQPRLARDEPQVLAGTGAHRADRI